MAIVIYHNPACGTSRNTLAMIRQSGEEPEIIEYLKTPPSRERLVQLLRAMSLTPRELLRRKGTPHDELGLDDPKWTDDDLIDFMIAHPILINRPVVVTPKGARLCRPSEEVLDILPNPNIGLFTKEDGEVIIHEKCQRHEIDRSMPNLKAGALHLPDPNALRAVVTSKHRPRILLLYGSVRPRSYSRFLTLEAARLLEHLGAETKIFDPSGLPLPDDAGETHPKVQELRRLVAWSEGQVWCSPERHGAMSGIMKAQIDWIPLNSAAVRPTQGKTLAVMQVSGGSQSFNAVNQMRILGRWMRMLTIPNQSSVAKAFAEFDEAGRMKPSSYYDRVVDVMEELMKFTLLTRDVAPYLTDRYSERVESAAELSARVNLVAATSVADLSSENCGCAPSCCAASHE